MFISTWKKSFSKNVKRFLEHKGNFQTSSKCLFFFCLLLLIVQLFSETGIHFCTEAFKKELDGVYEILNPDSVSLCRVEFHRKSEFQTKETSGVNI